MKAMSAATQAMRVAKARARSPALVCFLSAEAIW